MAARSHLFTLALVTFALAACREAKVTSYRVPKEKAAEPPAAAAETSPASPGMANTPVPTAGGPGLAWTPPKHWQPKAASAMRKGSFSVPGDGGATADLSITAFPGQVGGELANVNRWRGQISLPPITQAEFDAAATRLERNGLRMTVVDLPGPDANSQHILGGIIPYGDATWFIKLQGPGALVGKEKAAFMAFLETVKPARASAP